MRNIFIGFLMAFVAFYIGVSADNLFSVQEVSVNQNSPVIVKVKENQTEIVTSSNINTNNEIFYNSPTPDGIYFPINKKGLGPETSLILTVIKKDQIFGEIKVDKNLYMDNFIKIDNKKIKLITRKIKGIGYKFEGEFLKDGYKDFFEDGDIVLKGKLQKIVKGKQVSEVKTKFTYVSGLCPGN